MRRPATYLFLGLAGVSITPMLQTPRRQKDIPTITRQARIAVVLVVVADRNGKEIGQRSGFVVSKNGRVITNYHVVRRASSALIKFPNGAYFVVEGLLAADENRDIAVLKAEGQDFPVVALGDSDGVQVGEEVVAIGSPLSLEATVSNGIVSGVRELDDEGQKVLQITAPISPGSSGGPVFNMRGEVIGITAFHLARGQSLNFAIPINDAKPLLVRHSSELYPLPREVDETSAIRAPTQTIAQNTVSEKLWRNLKDGEEYRTRLLGHRLYVEHTSSGQGEFETCEFRRAVSVGLMWVGTCWRLDRANPSRRESAAFITSVSEVRIEGNMFVLIAKD